MAHLEKYKLVAVHNMVGHYAREAEARGYERENIDSSRTAQNYVVGFGTRVRDEGSGPEALARRVRDGVSEAIANHEADSGKRIRKDANVLCDWVITLPRDCPQERAGEFFEAAVKFVQERYGRENVPGGFVHMDEATPHMHVPVIPVQGKRLRASKVIDRADLKSFHRDLGRAEDEALGMHVSVELDPADKGARQLSHLGQDEYRAAKDELRRTRAEAEGWARLSRALGPSGDGADVPQEDGSVRHQQSVGQLVTQRETMRVEAEMQLELARQARQQAEQELSEARHEASQARVDAKRAREDVESAKSAQRAAEGARDAVQAEVTQLQVQRNEIKRLVEAEYQRHLQVKADNLLAEARTAIAEQTPTISLEDAEAVFSSFSRFVADRAIDLWETVRDKARELWRSWRHGGWGCDVAGGLGIGEVVAGQLADGALDAVADERGAWDVASDLEFGGAEKVASHAR